MTIELRVLNKSHDGMPPDSVYVGRPSKWGNPYHLNGYDRDTAIQKYKELIQHRIDTDPTFLPMLKRELGGKDLVCWCAPKPCHADFLLELSND